MRKLVLLLLIVGLIQHTTAQIMYTDENPDAIVSTWNVFTFHLADTTPSYLGYGTINLWFHSSSPNEVVALTGSDCQIMVNNLTAKLPLKLDAGDTVGSLKTWSDVSYKALNIGNTQGLWTGGVVNKYIGIRFKQVPGGSWMYGWVRLDVDATPDSFTVKDYAYNSETGSNMIYAGQISNSCIYHPDQLLSAYCFNDQVSNSVFIKFPNPENENFTISVFNLNGQLVQKKDGIKTGEIKLESRNWKRGMYLYRIESEKANIIQGKFMKE